MLNYCLFESKNMVRLNGLFIIAYGTDPNHKQMKYYMTFKNKPAP